MTPILHIQLLGGFRLIADNTPLTTFDSPRLQALLAYLLLQRAAPHARIHLAFQLWPDTTEAQAQANLRTLLHRLRQALPDANRFLHIDAQTVQWRGDTPFTLDVADFERALAQAAAAEQAGDQGAARTALCEAVEQYGGELLPALYDDWVLVERERLRQAFLAGLEKLILLLEQQQNYPAAIGYAQRLLRHDPLHEATYQHLMRLYALSGDRASAVRVYRTCATVLARELGVEPSPATHEAYERLRHMEAQPAPPAGRPSSHAEGDGLHNLPIALTSFIGRTREIAEITRLLTRTRLLTLTGAGGCGKTRLALAAANELVANYPDGVWLVDLAPLADPALVPQVVAAILGVREESQRSLTATLVDALRPRTLLLLLDNCEHLLDTCAHLAEKLLSAGSRLRILATSREPLGVAGETSWSVPSLSLPEPPHPPALANLMRSEAVELFRERAASALPTFTLTLENAPAVAQVCRRLDGIPLAIELAAVRVKVLSVAQLATRLDDCFRLLTGGGRTAIPRHQSLRAAIDWSYALLAEPERALFRRLSVFAGGWMLEAAESVCTGAGLAGDEILEVLAHLVDKSLVVVEAQAGGEARYRLLETVRQYAWDRLCELGEAAAIRGQHAAYYLALAEAAEPKLRGPQQCVWLDQLEQEQDNLRAALAWSCADEGDAQTGLRLMGALEWFWIYREHMSEGRRWLADVLARPAAAAPTVARMQALACGGFLAGTQNDFAPARVLLEESLALGQTLGDKHGIAYARNGLGFVAWLQRDYAAARVLHEESLALFQNLGNSWDSAFALNRLGDINLYLGDYARGVAALEASLALIRQVGDNAGLGHVLLSLGYAAHLQGDDARAAAYYEESLARFRTVGHTWGIAAVLHALGYVLRAQGDNVRAAACFSESLTRYWKMGQKGGTSVCLTGFAGLASEIGQPVRAARLFGAAEALRETIGLSQQSDERATYDRTVAALRAQLDAAAFAAAWAAGRVMTVEQAIADALAGTDLSAESRASAY
ncbi:MAG TPA: BTAD domain-containing putative transcriptional regulator [Roseiflexaceae bacterium]|nr:BTAD domain-containing putative transcriptional regulator [Roseiflexaceae bacterium]